MTKLSFVLALSLAAFGCKKHAADDCSAAVNHGMELSKADMKKMGNDDKTMAKMVDLGIQHCKDDKWPAEATKCMTDAKTMTDAQACYGKLTADQQQKMNKAAAEMAKPAAGAPAPAGGSGSAAAPK